MKTKIPLDEIENQLERAEMVLAQLGWKRAASGIYHHVETEKRLEMKADVELSDGHFAGCAPDCHINHNPHE